MTNPSFELAAKKTWNSGATTFNDTLSSTALPTAENTSWKDKQEISSVAIFDTHSLNQLSWPNNEEAQFGRLYLTAMIKQGPAHYIDNVAAEMKLLKVDDHIIPLLIVNNNYHNSYICSPFAHYISLGLESLHMIKNRILRKITKKSMKCFGKLLSTGRINRIVYVNHWLLSTDLYPKDLTSQQVAAISTFLQKKFPKHAIAFRSINKKTTPHLKSNLKRAGFQFIASRHIYLSNIQDPALFQTRIIKSDLRMWKELDYEIVEGHQLTDGDFERILQLYNNVSLEHHSTLNPQYNLEYIKLITKMGFLHIKALKKNEVIDGVVGYFVRDNVFMSPFFGYDKEHVDKTRLYRLLSTMLYLEASKNATTFHQGAGASFYKTVRRAVGQQEYFGIYSAHLPLKQRMAWSTLKNTINTAGAFYMKKY